MRAITLYNDNLNTGISILADFGKKGDWESVEAVLEEKIGDIKKFDVLETTVKGFPELFKDIKFLSGKIIKEVRGGRGVVNEPMPVDNPFHIQTSGYVVYNPNEINIEFAAA